MNPNIRSVIPLFLSGLLAFSNVLTAGLRAETLDRVADWDFRGNSKTKEHPTVVADPTCPSGGTVLRLAKKPGSDLSLMCCYQSPWNFTMKPETRYEISCWMRCDKPSRCRLGVDLWKSEKIRHYYRNPLFDVTDEWQLFQLVITTPTTNEYPVFMEKKGSGCLAISSRNPATELFVSNWTIAEKPRETKFAFFPPRRGLPSLSVGQSGEGNRLGNSSFEMGDAAWSVRCDYPITGDGVAPRVTVDETTAVHGRRSVKIDASATKLPVSFIGSSCALAREEEPLVLSAWVKAEKPCKVSLMFRDIAYDFTTGRNVWCHPSRSYPVSNVWTRIVLAQKTPRGTVRQIPQLSISPGTVVWVDAVQFEGGTKPTDYRPAAPHESAFVLNDRLIVREEKWHHRWVKPTRTAEFRTVDYEPLAVKTRPYEFKVDRYGCFELTGEYCGRPSLPVEYAVVRPVRPAKSGFRIGFNGGMDFRGPGTAPLIRTDEGPDAFDRTMRRLGLSGASVIRLHDVGFSWPDLEPEKGKFNWTAFDRVVDGLRAQGLDMIFVMGNGSLLAPKDPKKDGRKNWFVRKNAKEGGPSGMPTLRTMLPDERDWADYLAAVVEHTRGRIRYFEIVNEPNLQMPDPKNYFRYLKLSYETVKRVNPEAVVIGIDSTGDFGASLDKYIDAIGRQGGFDYLDMMSFHPYSAPTDVSELDAGVQMQAIRKLVEKYRPGVPLVEDELYYLADRRMSPSDASLPWDCPPGYLLRRYAIDLAYGCEISAPLHGGGLRVGDALRRGYDSNEWLSGHWAPSAYYPISNAAAHFLNGAKHRQPLHLPRELNGFLFTDRDGGELAVVWARFEAGTCRLRAKGLAVWDTMGSRQSGDWVHVTENPVYVRGKGLAASLTASAFVFDRPLAERRTVRVEMLK